MAHTDEVFAGIKRNPDVTYWALVPNAKGAQMAVDAGADSLSVIASASEMYSQKNVKKSVDEAITECERISKVTDKPIDAVISCSFGSPWEGDIDCDVVAGVARRLRDAGATSITLADTTGMGTPRRVMLLVHAVEGEVGFHFHDTRGTALVNAVAAMSAGAKRFDTSLGAIGGSPTSVDVGGNLGTEDLVHLLDDFGFSSGLDLEVLLDAGKFLRECLGHDLNSKIALRGPRLAGHQD